MYFNYKSETILRFILIHPNLLPAINKKAMEIFPWLFYNFFLIKISSQTSHLPGHIYPGKILIYLFVQDSDKYSASGCLLI